MPLYSLDGVQQPPIGRQQHWNLFLAFQGSPLHAEIVTELRPYLDASAVDSSIVGSRVLAAIEAREPQVLQACDQEEAGRKNVFSQVVADGTEANGNPVSHRADPACTRRRRACVRRHAVAHGGWC